MDPDPLLLFIIPYKSTPCLALWFVSVHVSIRTRIHMKTRSILSRQNMDPDPIRQDLKPGDLSGSLKKFNGIFILVRILHKFPKLHSDPFQHEMDPDPLLLFIIPDYSTPCLVICQRKCLNSKKNPYQEKTLYRYVYLSRQNMDPDPIRSLASICNTRL